MKAILNADHIEIQDALIPLSLYGMGVYSSLIVVSNRVKGWNLHLARLRRDAKEFLGLEVQEQKIVEALRLFLSNQPDNTEISCRVTVFPSSFSAASPHLEVSPSILVTGAGGGSVTTDSVRLQLKTYSRPSASYKTTNIATAMHKRGAAKKDGYDDPLFMRDEFITEGPTWNVFFILGDRLYTPSLEAGLLPGVTRQILINGFSENCDEVMIKSKDIRSFEAGFVTNAAIGVVPISEIDGVKYDALHPLIEKARNRYSGIPMDIIE